MQLYLGGQVQLDYNFCEVVLGKIFCLQSVILYVKAPLNSDIFTEILTK